MSAEAISGTWIHPRFQQLALNVLYPLPVAIDCDEEKKTMMTLPAQRTDLSPTMDPGQARVTGNAQHITHSLEVDDAEDLADNVNDYPEEVQYLTPDQKKRIAEKIIAMGPKESEEAAALMAILLSISDPFELAYVFGDCSAVMSPERLGGEYATSAQGKIDALSAQFDKEALKTALSQQLDGLYAVKRLLADPNLPAATRAKIIEIYGSEEAIAKAIEDLEYYSDSIGNIDTPAELQAVNETVTVVSRAKATFDRELPGMTPATAEDTGADIKAQAAASKDAQDKREAAVFNVDGHTLVEMFRSGKLLASDLTQGVMAKIQDELTMEGRLETLLSNYSRMRHDLAMSVVQNIKA